MRQIIDLIFLFGIVLLSTGIYIQFGVGFALIGAGLATMLFATAAAIVQNGDKNVPDSQATESDEQ